MKGILGNAITAAIDTFQPNELAFLALQGKIELQLRDKIAWYLEQNLPEEVEYVRKEFGIKHLGLKDPTLKQNYNLLNRSKCDLALLDKNLKPICLIEFKAHSCALNDKNYFQACKDDITKMNNMEKVLKKQLNMQSIQKFYVFFQTTHTGSAFPNMLTQNNKGNILITYYDIVKKGYKDLDEYLKINSGKTAYDFIEEQWKNAGYNQVTGSFSHQENYAGSYYGLDVYIHSMIIEC